jgi:hypothetical protein
MDSLMLFYNCSFGGTLCSSGRANNKITHLNTGSPVNKTALAVTILICIAVSSAVSVTITYVLTSHLNEATPSPSPNPTTSPEQTLSPTQTLTPTPTSTPTPTTEPTQTPTSPTPKPTPIPKPSVPEFNLSYVDLSYDVPPTYGVDPYTGKTIITQDGYHVDNRSIQFTIKNQPFTPYTDANGTEIGLYYNFRVKGAYATEWSRYYPFDENGVTTRRYGGLFGVNSTESPADLAQSNTEYTTIFIAIRSLLNDVTSGAQLEFQVQALVGHMEPTDYMLAGHVYVFTGESSDWSNTQTITIP